MKNLNEKFVEDVQGAIKKYGKNFATVIISALYFVDSIKFGLYYSMSSKI